MMSDKTEISITMKLPVNRPSRNGTVYTEEAIKNALKSDSFSEHPIVFFSDDGMQHKVGVIKGQPYAVQKDEDGNIKFTVDGLLFIAGTNESVCIDDNKVVSMDIKSVGVSSDE